MPCVITMPSTSGDGSSSLMRFATFSMISNDMSCEPMFEICSPLMFARSVAPGTAFNIASIVTAPEL